MTQERRFVKTAIGLFKCNRKFPLLACVWLSVMCLILFKVHKKDISTM